ncbi:hypothetical protein [Rhodomicrobium vannielii]|uniref:hypothetical protein n=1 Tax=Rhodomicrobium vannielii TaxID=1069 RepID=UPI0012DE88B0|nr:hypothetical protein [Rhodomicrobium vannielii]
MTEAKSRRDLSDGPSPWRRQHTAFTRDVLTPPGAPVVARHRARPILTPHEMRLAILEDAAGKPEAVRIRSLRRRLTVLDRALSDREAQALERLSSCIAALKCRCGQLPQIGGALAAIGRPRAVRREAAARDRGRELRAERSVRGGSRGGAAARCPSRSGLQRRFQARRVVPGGRAEAAAAAVRLYDAFAVAPRQRGEPIERETRTP